MTSQTATLPTVTFQEKTSFKVVVSSTKESSKFVSCVDIEEKLDESSDESNLDNDEQVLEAEKSEPKTELQPSSDSPPSDANDQKVAELKDPNFFQYFFGCLPCVGNPK